MGNEVLQGSASTILIHGERLEILIDGGDNKRSEEIKQWPFFVNEISCMHNPNMVIEKVPPIIREVQANTDCYDPSVVSIGPYHHGNPKYAVMEKHKRTMANNFANNSPQMLERLYNKIMDVAEAAKECYKDDEKGTVANFKHEEFTNMLFLDGCFVLQFIDCCGKGKFDDLGIKYNIAAFVKRDLFLLENQLPFLVLKELMILKDRNSWRSSLEEFIPRIFAMAGGDSKEQTGQKEAVLNIGEHAHLLALTRSGLIGTTKNDTSGKGNDLIRTTEKDIGKIWNNLFPRLISTTKKYTDKISKLFPRLKKDTDEKENFITYRSVMELKSTGINFEPSKTKQFIDVEFKRGFLTSKLTLPTIIVDDFTKTMLLNMVAYEACLGGAEDFGVTSYICFLDSLIDHAEDVKELRSEGILRNLLGSDQQVADIFNQIADNLVSNPHAYAAVQEKIQNHYKNTIKKWLAEFWHTHFTSPWTILAFLGAILVLILSVLQTFPSILPGQRER